MSTLLTRRDFVVGTSAVLAAPPASAADAPLLSFALVTDTHLGKPGADYVKRMATAVTEINDAAVEFTVFCGDLVDRGEVEANQHAAILPGRRNVLALGRRSIVPMQRSWWT